MSGLRRLLGRDPGDAAAIATFRAAEWGGMHLPAGMGRGLSEGYLRLRYERMDRERRTVARNLSRVLGEPPESALVQTTTREAFRLYGRYWFDTFALRTMPWEEVRRRFRVPEIGLVDEALAAGRGAVLALPHMGNWDAAGHWLAVSGYPIVSVAEELRPREVFDLFYRHRRALGMEIVPLSEVGTAAALVAALARNRVVALVPDRNLSGRGVEVEMFGARRPMPPGPALLSLATGAPLLPATVRTAEDGWDATIEPPLTIERSGAMREDVGALTRALAARFERFIASAPADWHVFQPAWPEDEEVGAVPVGEHGLRAAGSTA